MPLPPYEGSGLLPGTWGALNEGIAKGPKVFRSMRDACRLRPCNRTLLKNCLVPFLSGGGTEKNTCQNPRVWYASPVVWGALRSGVLGSARLVWVLPQHWIFPPASRGHPSWLLPPYLGLGLLPGTWRGRRYFWQWGMLVGYGPATEPTLKGPCVKLLARCGAWQTTDQTHVVGPPLQLFGARFGRLCFGQRGSFECCLNNEDFLRPQEGRPPGFYPLTEGWVFAWHLRRP